MKDILLQSQNNYNYRIQILSQNRCSYTEEKDIRHFRLGHAKDQQSDYQPQVHPPTTNVRPFYRGNNVIFHLQHRAPSKHIHVLLFQDREGRFLYNPKVTLYMNFPYIFSKKICTDLKAASNYLKFSLNYFSFGFNMDPVRPTQPMYSHEPKPTSALPDPLCSVLPCLVSGDESRRRAFPAVVKLE